MSRSTSFGFVTALALVSGALDPRELAAQSIEAQSRTHLKSLGRALARYMLYSHGNLPSRLSELYEQNFLSELDAFTSPASGTKIATGKEIDDRTDYYLTINPADDRPLLLLKEKKGFHDGKALAFYSDGKIRLEEPGFPSKLLKPSTLRRVPQVAGMDEKEAMELIEQLGFKANFSFGKPAPIGAKAGRVESMTPRAGVLRDMGSELKVTLYATSVPTKPESRGDSLVGLAVAAAKKQLESKGLRADIALGKPASRKADEYAVYEHMPANLADVRPGGTVRLTIYGPVGVGVEPPLEPGKVRVPDVTKLSHLEAKRALEAQGFKVRFELGDPAPTPALALHVYRMSLSAGSASARGETVTLTIYGK